MPNDQYTCHVSHIVIINVVGRFNWNDAFRSQIEDLRSISRDTLSKEPKDSRGDTHRVSTVVYFEGRGLGLLQKILCVELDTSRRKSECG